MPAVFFGHGNPMNALAENDYSRAWAEIGRSIRKPKTILCISAHWYIGGLAVTAMERPRTIHDFGGFPKELFEVEYPAPGSPEMAERVNELLGGDVVQDHEQWGIDHGTWSVLVHAFPDADVPVIQLSVDRTKPARWHHDLASLLAPLRDEGVLIIGSGNIVHNLREYAWGAQVREPFAWAESFDQKVREVVLADTLDSIIEYQTLGPDAEMAVPTPDHFLPLLYVLAQRQEGDSVSFPVTGYEGGSISMTSVMVR